MSRLCIIVPIYKNPDLLRACVDSLLAHIGEVSQHDPRLILINDSPGDPAIEALVAEYAGPGVLVLRNDENAGFVRSANRGLRVAIEDRRDALLVNSDTRTYAGTLSALLQAAKADPQIGFACPRSNNASICSLPHFFGGLPPTPEAAYERWRTISRTMPLYHFVPTAVGFYLFIKHGVLANHGLLNEGFGLGYEEENDLVMRAGKVGTRAVIVNHSFAYHAGSASFNLLGLDLGTHKQKNLTRLSEMHPEFLPLVKRYEQSPHYRAEGLMSGLIPDSEGRIKVAFDLTGMGQHFNGTNEQSVAVLRSLVKRHSHRFNVAGVASAQSFRCHGLDEVEGLRREEPEAPGLHGIAVRLAQPYSLRHTRTLENLAPVNVYAMLDTISEDCGPLALDGEFLELWDYVAEHASGLVFTSRFTQETFYNRHGKAWSLPSWQCLLPTRLASYAKPRVASQASHVLVLGNHFAHKGSEAAARTIAAAFPTLRIVALGAETSTAGNLSVYRAGLIGRQEMEDLFTHASMVVLPSYVEGFGFGLMHALAAGRPVVARRIRATEEILATLDDVQGVFLFETDADLTRACTDALAAQASRVKDGRGTTWDDWADGLADFCLSLARREDVFGRLVGRLKAGDLLRRASYSDGALTAGQRSAPDIAPQRAVVSNAKPVDLAGLLALDGQAFVEHAYATLLCRPVDEAGLKAYLSQLELGAPKVELLHALAHSPEGRLRDVHLPGLDQMVAQHRRAQMPRLKRIFASS